MTKKEAEIIAFLGKGGAGKTALSCLTAHLLLREEKTRLLLIDADPALGLAYALSGPVSKTVGEVRTALLAEAGRADSPAEQLALTADYLMLEALEERRGYSLLAMGHTEGPGCFCSVNSLLRDSIEDLARHFDWIIIDAEAGIEQVSRQVARRVDHPIVVTDSSLRGAATARAIAEALDRAASPPPKGVIFNRSERPDPALARQIEGAGLSVLGSVPADPNLARFDREGRALLELPRETPALCALEDILKKETNDLIRK